MAERNLYKENQGEGFDFKMLVDQYQESVLNLCYRFVNHREDAEDVAQDVFVEIYRSIGNFRNDAKLSTWIHRIAVNKSLDFVRKKNRKKRFGQVRYFLGLEEVENQLRASLDSQPEVVLETSDATFKFIFSHQLVGGIHTGEGRGGIEMAPYYEWGGKNRDDNWGFDTKRAGWYKPIHQLMVENNVSAFFHGHDHVFVKQELDGVVYQVLPQPSNTNYRNGDKIAAEGGYFSGTVLGNSGHLRVTVSSDDVLVEYIRAYLPGDEGAGRRNGEVGYSYRIKKK